MRPAPPARADARTSRRNLQLFRPTPNEIVIVERRAAFMAVLFSLFGILNAMPYLRPSNLPEGIPAPERELLEQSSKPSPAPFLACAMLALGAVLPRWTSRVDGLAKSVTVEFALGTPPLLVPLTKRRIEIEGPPVVRTRKVWRGPLDLEVGDARRTEVVASALFRHASVDAAGRAVEQLLGAAAPPAG